ncbi:hypothetical protein OG896_24410 [Streptomyces sp. NBC_00669]|uniref:hypothetical protein n=1 Tax=Streptomyces sp. NBC_00669 TaxID=2976011 RepID=UPI002E337850|nr:hypothetical protein [Streptomyces sp. NBC_00669]
MSTSEPTPADRLREQILTAIEQYELDRATETATDDFEDDPLSRNYLRWLAKHQSRANRKDPSERDRQLAQMIADEFSLQDVRILRAAAEAVAAATPAIVMKHVGDGMEPPEIATEMGLTPSRVYGIIREQRQRETQAIIAAGIANDPDPKASYEKWERVLATTTDPAERATAEQFLAEFRAALPDKKAEPRST